MARYIENLLRFKVRFAFLLVVVPAVVGAVTILLSPSYKAVAQLWVDDPSFFGATVPTGWNQYLTPAQNESDSIDQLLSTRAFSRDLYGRLADVIPDPAQRFKAVSGAKITVAASGTHLIVITATCQQKPICILLVNRAIDALRSEQIQTEQDNARAGQTFVTAQLQQAKTDQANAQDALRRYIALHPSARVDATADPNTLQDPELSRLAVEVQQQSSRVTNLQNQLTRDNNIVSASTAVIQSGPRMVDPPVVTRGFPIGDGSGLRKAALAAGASLGIGLAYLFLLSWLDKTLRDPREIEHRFKVLVVTSIPELQPSERF